MGRLIVLSREGTPERVGPYTVERELRAPDVYLAADAAGTRVAVKVVRHDGDADFRRRFATTAHTLSRAGSFCAAAVAGFDVDEESAYLAMEYVDGPDLRELVAAGGPLTGPRLDRLAVGTALALSSLHEAGLVHGDVRPATVRWVATGPKLVGFPRLAAPLVPAPAPPPDSGPVASSRPAGPETAADVLAWAATVLYAATGTAAPPPGGPAGGGAAEATLRNADLPAPLRAALNRALAADPADRPAARRIYRTLVGADRPRAPDPPRRPRSGTRPSGVPARAARSRSRTRLAAAAAAILLVLAAAGSVAAYLAYGPAPRPAPAATPSAGR